MDNTVFIIDDDASVRDALGLMLGLRGFRCTVFADAAGFLAAWRADWHGCLIIDIRMKGMDGLSLQRELQSRGCAIPVVIITGHGDIGTAREAFRAAAIDFLEKPLDESTADPGHQRGLRPAVGDAAQLGLQQDGFVRRLIELTPREREVMELVIAGRHNREIAKNTGHQRPHRRGTQGPDDGQAGDDQQHSPTGPDQPRRGRRPLIVAA
jgi:FixJ family two-component response regulator